MTASARYGLWSGLVAVAALPVVGLSVERGPALAWGVAGWGAMALAGVAGGAWLAARHGGASRAFLVALGTTMGARATLGVAGALAAGRAGALGAYVAGLVAGYAPLQAFEMLWFLRAGRTGAAGCEVGRR